MVHHAVFSCTSSTLCPLKIRERNLDKATLVFSGLPENAELPAAIPISFTFEFIDSIDDLVMTPRALQNG